MADDRGREIALEAVEHIVNMSRERDASCELKFDASDCLSEGADLILEAAEKIIAARQEK
jgi:hypothetical protein